MFPSIPVSSFMLFSFTLLILAILGFGLYNLSFHPYSKYPGPFPARVSSFYSLWHAYKGDLHLDVLRCHEKYGPFVRYAPNRLLVNTTTGLKAVYGQGSNFKKCNGYAPHPYFPAISNTHNTIDKAVHGRKRRIVAQGFSELALASSEKYILHHVYKLCDALIADIFSGSTGWSVPRDMAVWTNYFTLDVISDLTFGRSFCLITSPSLRWLMDAIVTGNRHIYMRFACPWLFNLPWGNPAKRFFPNMDKERIEFTAISDQYTKERMKLIEEGKCDRKDIMAALLVAKDPKTGTMLSQSETWSEAHLMIAAGGDTTSTALAAVLFYLSRSPVCHRTLLTELQSTFKHPSEIKRGKFLSSCVYLKACIDEALRLAPAAPGALWREACEGGAWVDGEFIPQGGDVGTSIYALSHSEEYFEDPFKFEPERFLKAVPSSIPSPSNFSSPTVLDPELDDIIPQGDNFNAFAPFLIGPRSCLAKPLAYLELMLCTAHLVLTLDFEAVDLTGGGGKGLGKGREREGEFQVVDMFSSNKKGPVLRFKRRIERQD